MSVWTLATNLPWSPPENANIFSTTISIVNCRSRKIITDPTTLNKKWIIAALFASFFPAKEANRADPQEPILQPKIIKIQIGSIRSPSLAMRRTMLTVTEELCIIAVRIVPAKMAKRGLFKLPNITDTCSTSFSPAIASAIILSPMNRTPNPKMTSPTFSVPLFFTKRTIRAPTSKKTGAASDRFKDTN